MMKKPRTLYSEVDPYKRKGRWPANQQGQFASIRTKSSIPKSSFFATLLLVLLVHTLQVAAGQILPDELIVNVGEVTGVGTNVAVVLAKRSVRSDTYAFYVQTPEGRKRAEPFPVSTYRGYVKGDPSMRVTANIEPGGILSANFSEGRDIIGHVTKLSITVGTGKSTPLMIAGNKVVPMSSITTRVSPTRAGYTVPPVPMRLVRIDLDVAPEPISECPSLEAAVSRAEQRINDADFNFARNVATAWEIDCLIMNVSEPLLKGVTLSADQNIQPEGKTGKMGVTFCAAGNGCRGGHPAAAGLGQEAGALMHEAGHAFGCPHGLDKNDAMKGCRAFFGPNNTRIVVNTMNGRSSTEYPAVIYNGTLPPQAQDDIAETPKEKPVTIDVLDNDFDGNGDSLTLKSVGPKCVKGGTVTLSPDRMKVIYTPPTGFVGLDSFKYEVVDSTGTSSRAGEVDVNVITEGVAAYFDFNKVEIGATGGRGSSGDSFKNGGPVGDTASVLFFKPLLVPGVRGNAVFNGINAGWGPSRTGDWMHQMNIPNIGDPGPGNLSVSIWVLYPRLVQNMQQPHKKCVASSSGVILGKGGIKYVGNPNAPYGTGWAIIHLPHYKGFKFLGANGAGSFDLKSSDPIQPNTWYHLVMVMDRKAQKLKAWVNNKELTESSSTSDLLPGDIYDAQDLRLLNGDVWQWWHSYPVVLDELKIYNTVLTPKQVSELYAEGKDAKAPDLSAFRRDEKADVPVAEDPKYEVKQYVKPEEKEPDDLGK